MKNVFALALITFATAAASAQNLIDTKMIRNLPEVRVISVEVDPGPMMAAVQPTAFVQFEHYSCAKQPFSANVQENDGILFVALELPKLAMDCMGLPVKHQYSLQISSDYNHKVVILNPAIETTRK